MDVRKIRETSIALPDQPELLDPVDRLPRENQAMTDCAVAR